MKKKPPTSIRLSEEAKRLAQKLAEQMGLSRSAVIEHAIRVLAKKEKVN